MITADLVVRDCSQLVTCGGPIPKRRGALREVGVLEGGCLASFEGRIVYLGDARELRSRVRLTSSGQDIDGTGLTALPGFVDPHTHLPFAGSREEEFRLRMKGHSYLELAAKGMGIQTTVEATRRASEEELVSLSLSRLDNMLCTGTTTVEAKSGYGLNLEDELKQLRALKKVQAVHPVDVVPTFLGAHEVPKEYKGRKQEYIDFLTQQVLPRVTEENLAEFFDVFCEEGVYSIDETRRLVRDAKQAGLKVKIHADEFVSLGGAELAVEEGAVSAEHLIAVSDAGIEALARSSTAAILLPGVSFFLMMDKTAPARKMIDQGVVVALATDFNPGSSMTESMFFILQLGVFTLRMGIEESINAVTANAAYAIDRQAEVGSLELGKKTDLVLFEAPNYPYLVHHLGINPVKHVIKNGKLVVKDGMRLY